MAKKRRSYPTTRQHELPPQNASPVTRLPPEILSQIFLYHARPPPHIRSTQEYYSSTHDLAWFCGHGTTSNSSKQDLTWLRILRVCRQWRHVALSCPLLWTNIDTKIRSLRVFMLEHSRDALICLRKLRIGKDMKSERNSNKKLVFDNLLRLRQLGLVFHQCSAEEMERTLIRLLSSEDAPRLEALELESESIGSVDIEVPNPQPSLSSLTLVRLLVSFPRHSILDGVTQLSLEFDRLFETAAGVEWFYNTLKHMPNLLRLHIVDQSHHFNPSNPTHTTQAISLPLLQCLSFFGLSPAFVYISRCLSLPPTTYYQLTFTELRASRDEEEEATAALDAVVSSILEARVQYDTNALKYQVKFSLTTKFDDDVSDCFDPEVRSIRTMVLATPPELPRTSLESSSSARIPAVRRGAAFDTKASAVPVLTIEQQSDSWEWQDGCLHFPGELSKITDALPAESVEEIHIRSNMPLKDPYDDVDDDDSQTETDADESEPVKPANLDAKLRSRLTGFLRCENVKTLRLEGSHPIDWMCDYLKLTRTQDPNATANAEHSGPSPSLPQTFAVFPKLETLALINVDWDKETDIDEIYDASACIPPIMRSVADMLKKRARLHTGGDGRDTSQSRIKRLEVVGGVPEGWVRKIEAGKWIGGDGCVEWDSEARCAWEEGWDEAEEEAAGEEDGNEMGKVWMKVKVRLGTSAQNYSATHSTSGNFDTYDYQ